MRCRRGRRRGPPDPSTDAICMGDHLDPVYHLPGTTAELGSAPRVCGLDVSCGLPNRQLTEQLRHAKPRFQKEPHRTEAAGWRLALHAMPEAILLFQHGRQLTPILIASGAGTGCYHDEGTLTSLRTSSQQMTVKPGSAQAPSPCRVLWASKPSTGYVAPTCQAMRSDTTSPNRGCPLVARAAREPNAVLLSWSNPGNLRRSQLRPTTDMSAEANKRLLPTARVDSSMRQRQSWLAAPNLRSLRLYDCRLPRVLARRLVPSLSGRRGPAKVIVVDQLHAANR